MTNVIAPVAETSAALAAAVDRLAAVKATIANLTQEETALKAQLVDSGYDIVESMLFRASISACDGRLTTDWKSIAAHFKPSRQLITAHTSQGAAYHMVRVSARKTS